MDPITHGLLGGTICHAAFSRHLGRKALFIGAVSAMAPDVDIFIRSPSDPLLALEFHRHFTHALAFIPVGALLVALPWLLRKKNQPILKWIYAASFLGYATHGILDLFTSYGINLFLPFSRTRPALDWIAIIDPIFTIALAVSFFLSFRKTASRYAANAALIFCSLYLCLGIVQKNRALEAQQKIALSRKDSIERSRVMPMPGVNFVWRSIYLSHGRVHADLIRIPIWNYPAWIGGESADLYQAIPDPEIQYDVHRLEYFSDGWLGTPMTDPSLLADLRYSLDSSGFRPLWALKIENKRMTLFQDRSGFSGFPVQKLWGELTGEDVRYKPVP